MSSSTEHPLLEVGYIARPHGLRGEVLVALTTTETQRLDEGAELVADPDRLVVVSATPHQKRWIVQFDGIVTREQADALRGRPLLAPPLESEPDDLWVHELIGARVVELDGTDRGQVVEILDNPASDILVLDSGALVPLTFEAGWERPGVLRIDPPTGLFDDLDEG